MASESGTETATASDSGTETATATETATESGTETATRRLTLARGGRLTAEVDGWRCLRISPWPRSRVVAKGAGIRALRNGGENLPLISWTGNIDRHQRLAGQPDRAVVEARLLDRLLPAAELHAHPLRGSAPEVPDKVSIGAIATSLAGSASC